MPSRSISRLSTLLLICAICGAAGVRTQDARASTELSPGEGRLNVILIMTDDQGYGDFGVTGNPVIRTPNIDTFAAESASMATFYVSPVCAPTRASLMTGRYNYRTRVVDTWIGRAMMEPEEVTIAEVLRDAGYATGIFGKWHLGDCFPMRAIDQGFEMALVHRGGGIGQPSDPPGGERKYTDPILFRNGEPEQMNGYCTDIYFNEAMKWMKQSHEADRPFFAYIATNAPHGPFHDVPPESYDSYRETDLGNGRFPQETGHPLPEQSNQDRRARIYAMITNIDENVGRMLAKLDGMGIAESTLVIFMVDNGPNGRRFVAGMRGMKSEVHEGGIRSPFFIRWPARLKPGHSSDRIAAHIDVMPTILEACGVDPPANVPLDGRSLLPLLENRDVDWPDRSIVIQTHRGDVPVRYHHFALRTQRRKLVHPSGFGREDLPGPLALELYDMADDPLELRDVAAAHPEIVALLRSTYDAWFDDVSATRRDNYEPPRIHLGSPQEKTTVLTRQDWRHIAGRPWGNYSLGRWLVHIERQGRYAVECRFPTSKSGGTIELTVGESKWRGDLEGGAQSHLFTDIHFDPTGDASLIVTIQDDEGERGPHQVDVSRIGAR